MAKVRIFKLINGEEIIAMYIKSKLFTVVIDTPVAVNSTGSLVDPRVTLDKFSMYGQDRMELRRSAIVSIIEPVPEMVEYYKAVADWVRRVIDPNTHSQLETERKQITDFTDASEVPEGAKAKTPEEILASMTAETKSQIFTHLLEEFDHTGRIPN